MSLWLRMLLVTAPPGQVRELAAEHRATVRRRVAEGKIRVAGELGRGDGFVEIFVATDRREAEDATRAVPLVEAGLCTTLLRELDPGTLVCSDATESG